MDYNECIQMINAAEAYDTQPRIGDIDLLDLGPLIDIVEYDEDDVSRLIDYLNSVEGNIEGTEAYEQRQMSERSGTLVGKLVNAEVLGSNTIRKGSSIAKELESLLSATGSEFMSHVRDSGDKLVLPTLSLQDQISELEKISVGLDSSSFSPEELKIIRMEVVGLMKRKRPAPSDEFQRNLASMRDVRLKDVSRKLGL